MLSKLIKFFSTDPAAIALGEASHNKWNVNRSLVLFYFKLAKKSNKKYFDSFIKLGEQDTVLRDNVSISSYECSLTLIHFYEVR